MAGGTATFSLVLRVFTRGSRTIASASDGCSGSGGDNCDSAGGGDGDSDGGGGGGDGVGGGGQSGGLGAMKRAPQSVQSAPNEQYPCSRPKLWLLSFGPPSWQMSLMAPQLSLHTAQNRGGDGGDGGEETAWVGGHSGDGGWIGGGHGEGGGGTRGGGAGGGLGGENGCGDGGAGGGLGIGGKGGVRQSLSSQVPSLSVEK